MREAPASPEPALERRRPRLASIHGAHLGRRWTVEACGIVIGRDPAQVGLVLPDPAISARHCALEHEPVMGEFTLSDLGSRNGTYVNGEKATERRLEHGDKLFVGETVLEFTLDDELGASFHSGINGRVDVDALTGLLVKRAFDLEFARAFSQVSDRGAPLSLLMMEVAELDAAAGTKAQRTGALCIAEVGRIIREEVADSGCACRFAADGFLAFLSSSEIERATALAERLCARVGAYAFEREGARALSAICIGIAELPPGLPTPDHLLQLADEALYRAKSAGANQVSR